MKLAILMVGATWITALVCSTALFMHGYYLCGSLILLVGVSAKTGKKEDNE